MKKLILLATGFILLNFQQGLAQCTQWTNPSPNSVYGTFNNPPFYGAPCDDGTGCSINEITAFEVFAGDAYRINDFVEGGTYTFSICNGPNAGTWVPEFTIIDPQGFVEKFGPGDGDSCSITWTAAKSGRYIVLINSAGNCGNGPYLAVSNGYPSLTCNDGTLFCSEPDTVCEAGSLASTALSFLCPGEIGNIRTSEVSVPTGGGFQWVFFPGEDAGGGNAPDGFALPATSIYNYSFDAGLNGILANSSLEDLTGTWSIQGRIGTDFANISNTICDTTAKRTFVFLDSAAAPCQDICDTVSFQISFSVTNESVAGMNDGEITVEASGGSGSLSFIWDFRNKRTPTISNLPAGQYCIEVYDDNLCSSGLFCTEVKVGIDPCDTTDIKIEYIVTNESLPNAGDGAIDLTVSGGTGDYTFSWSNGAMTEDIGNLVPNVYSVTVTDENDCKSSTVINVNAGSVGVKNLSNIQSIKVYPNPLPGNTLYLLANVLESQNYDVSIWSIAGSLVWRQEIIFENSGNYKIDCSRLESGNYLLKIAGKQEYTAMKFQIMK